MPAFTPFTLQSERLRLRFLAPGDAGALFAIFSNAEVMRYGSSAAWTDPARAHALIDEILAGYADGTLLQLGIEIEGTVCGTVTLRHFDMANRRCEIGFMLARPYWGTGVMQEAVPALLDHAFDTLGMLRIEADIDPRNTASARLLQRLGFRHEGLLRERWLVNGEVCDSDYYGLLLRDWRQHRRTLTAL